MSGPTRDYRVEIEGEALRVVVERKDDLFVARVGDAAANLRPVRVLRGGEHPLVLVGGRVVALSLGAGDPRGFSCSGHQGEVRLLPAEKAHAAARAALAGSGNVTAPMPGRVVLVRTRVGDAVELGAPLVVVEAMKMQNELVAPRSGTVSRVLVKEGDTVDRGATLVELA
jgi:biotin carboxyl carrier protein